MNRKNITLFYVLAFLQGLCFYSSIATLYRTSNGISLLEMGIIESIFSILMILFELPWGIICDRIGYKKTMVIANGFYFLSKVVFWKADNFGMFLLERLLLALSASGLSGCDSGLLYLSSPPEKAAGNYGRQSMFSMMGMTVASISFTLFFKNNLRGAAFATVITYFLNFIATLFFDDIKETQKKEISFRAIFQSLLKKKEIFILLLAAVLLTDTTHTLTIFYNQLQYERIGIPVEYYGIIFMALQFVSMSCGLLENITRYITKEKLACFLYALAGTAIVGLFFSEKVLSTIVCLMVLTCVESMFFPILVTIENESVDLSSRATMLSVYSLIINLFTAFTSFSYGKAANVSLQSAYLLAFGFCAGGLLLFAVWRKISRNKNHI